MRVSKQSGLAIGLFLLAVLSNAACADPLPGFVNAAQFPEQERWTRLASGVRIYVNAPRELPRKERTLVVYATPNGSTIEQTLGCARSEGLHWQYDIQHIAAQIRRLRQINAGNDVILAVVQAPRLAWPAFRQTEKEADAFIRETVESLAAETRATHVVLAAHSGGGSFLIGYINAAEAIARDVDRIVFLDANYSYANDQRHGDKLLDWLKDAAVHKLVVIAYDDRQITLNGKPVVGPTGGTFRATERMLERFRKDAEIVETKWEAFNHLTGLAGQIEFFVHPNPDNKILHTALVGDMNGLLHGLTLGTDLAGQWGKFGGPIAYADWIQPQPFVEPIARSLAAAPVEYGLTIPPRPDGAPTGSEFLKLIETLTPAEREKAILAELTRGNVPDFFKSLKTIRLKCTAADGATHEAACFVTPDYLSIGTDGDFFRIPMTPQTAQAIASAYHGSLITRKLSDAIYVQSELKIAPHPLTKDREAAATFYEHHRLIEAERRGSNLGLVVAGIKKDVVLSSQLRNQPGKVAIYGWHYPDGKPIQPLYVGHAARYVDYSHGIRLVSSTLVVDGKALSMADVLTDPVLSELVSDEGSINTSSH